MIKYYNCLSLLTDFPFVVESLEFEWGMRVLFFFKTLYDLGTSVYKLSYTYGKNNNLNKTIKKKPVCLVVKLVSPRETLFFRHFSRLIHTFFHVITPHGQLCIYNISL